MPSASEVRHVWIINHHAALPSKDGRAGRHLALAQHLRDYGWDVTIVASSTTHPSGAQQLPGPRRRLLRMEGGTRTVWLKTNAYGNSTIKRLVGMVAFAANALVPGAFSGVPKPDIVIGSTVHPFAAWAGSLLARRFGVPFVYEVRDVWPESLIDLGKMSASSVLGSVMRALAIKSAERAALVVSPLRELTAYLSEIGHAEKSFVWIPNGVEATDPLEPPATVMRGRFEFMYLGSHGTANVIDYIIRSFARAVELLPGSDLRLRLVGDGPMKEEYRQYARTLPVAERVTFEPRIARSEVLARAREADCMVMALPSARVFRFGISPNKLFDYLQAARPIVISVDQPNPVADSGAGVVTPAGDEEAFARAMVRMTKMAPERRSELGRRGSEHVVEHYGYGQLASRLDRALRGVVGTGGGTTVTGTPGPGDPASLH